MSKVQKIVVEKIIQSLNTGVAPWHKSWFSAEKQNLVTKRPYRGINRLLLADCKDSFFLSFKQVQELGGMVKRGSKGHLIVFWMPYEVKSKLNEGAEEKKTIPILRYYKVFGISQTEGIEAPIVEREHRSFEDAENLIENCDVNIEFNGSDPAYSPQRDTVYMPRPGHFETIYDYYGTMFHEIAHSTGHEKRLNRGGVRNVQKFGSKEYGVEELVAEITSAMVCNHFNINLIKNSASYCCSWIRAINENSSIIFSAARDSEKAFNYIIGKDE